MTLPVAAVLAKALYGEAIDSAEFAKQVDAADVHIDGPLSAAKKRKPRRGTDELVPAPVKLAQRASGQQLAKAAAGEHKTNKTAAIGLGASGVASVAGIHALTATRGENTGRAKKVAAGEYRIPKAIKLLRPKVSPARAAAVAGGGLLALHGVELVGDALAVHTQARALKKPVAKGMPKISLRPVNPAQARKVVSLKARRPPGSPPPMAKGVLRNAKTAMDAGSKAAQHVEEITGKAKKLVPKPRTAVFGGVGLVTAAGGANTLGTYEGARRGVKRGLQKSFTAPVLIAKRDEERKQVFGWANVSVKDGQLVVDRQGDVIHIDELEKMAYDYVQDSRVGGDQHARIGKGYEFSTDLGPRKTATMIESMVFTPDKIEKMGLPSDFPQGWWTGYQIQDDAVWADIKSGKRTGFSIHGTGRRTPIPGDLVGVGKSLDLRERTRQAIHPPPVKRKAVESAAMRSLGYQPQTRKLAIQMRSREEPYNYRVDQATADAVLTAPSKGKAYHAHIRNKAKHHTRYRVSDRARLFAHPDQS